MDEYRENIITLRRDIREERAEMGREIRARLRTMKRLRLLIRNTKNSSRIAKLANRMTINVMEFPHTEAIVVRKGV